MHINEKSRFMRPAKYFFTQREGVWPPEYYRWFDQHGEPRPAPLDEDQLVRFLMKQEDGLTIKEARLRVREKSLARKGDKAAWLQAQNPLAERIVAAMRTEIESAGLEVLQRYPNDLLVHDRGMLQLYAVPGTSFAWTCSDSSTHMTILGMHPKKNEMVDCFTNLSSRQRFYHLVIHSTDRFTLREVTSEAFIALGRNRCPYSKKGSNETFDVYRHDDKIGSIGLNAVGNWHDKRYDANVHLLSSSILDEIALDIWTAEAPVAAAGTLFVRLNTPTWHFEASHRLPLAA